MTATPNHPVPPAKPLFVALIADDMRHMDDVIRASLYSEVALVRQVSEYNIHSGGKGLGPALLLRTAGACGAAGEQARVLAAVVEFIHTATLLHDDVVDESSLRRGRETANELFGNAASVLVGDFLYSRAFQMMVSVGRMRVMEVLSEATNVIAEGEVLQLMNCNDPDVTEARYLQVIRYKTAKLFEAASRLGGALADATPSLEEGLARYGMHLGTAFQIIDDVLDYSGNEADTGKHLGDDLAEGKPTLPLIYARGRGAPEIAAAIRQAIESGGLEEFDAVLKTVHESGALDAARDAARNEAALARNALVDLPDSIYKQALEDLADFAVARCH